MNLTELQHKYRCETGEIPNEHSPHYTRWLQKAFIRESQRATVADIIRKVVGPITPIGETNEDGRRLENLRELGKLVNELVGDIDQISYRFKDSYKMSLIEASKLADQILTKELGISNISEEKAEETEKFLRGKITETMGWVWAEACSRLDDGLDPRKLEVSDLIGRHKTEVLGGK